MQVFQYSNGARRLLNLNFDGESYRLFVFLPTSTGYTDITLYRGPNFQELFAAVQCFFAEDLDFLATCGYVPPQTPQPIRLTAADLEIEL